MKVEEFRSSRVEERRKKEFNAENAESAEDAEKRKSFNTGDTEEEHGGHGEEKPKSTAKNGCATRREPKRGRASPALTRERFA